ncbi:hypothetical protein BFP72_04590 [Reichenbachiella sp. 5M10]|uniref:response regulator n=1 Tax=Reichenbachiella sp. 5M10 TaxID=1889772 RepID=UPI000C150E75|nr:response regulator [Reichenbachiella sp. 5M10]PIB34735.1 hypothetical protein BFP72_04590 [Reichenbachiella sp. 5M10]
MIDNVNDIEIVLVEDNHWEAELTIRALKKTELDSKLIWLKNGEEVKELLLNEEDDVPKRQIVKPKLILIDLNLPKINGVEIISLLKSDSRTKNIPIVVMTSSSQEGDLNKCYELGVNSYVVKPGNYQSFSEACNQIGLYWTMTNRAIE